MATAEAGSSQPTLPVHGASVLPSVIIDTYNCELEDEEGFVGDKACKSAFHEILDRVREEPPKVRRSGEKSSPRERLRRRRLFKAP
jgi:hypothetical protein